MAALAEGLRAIPSVAEAAARPWPIPHPAAAIAMAIPAAAATQLVVPAAPSPWARAGTAKQRADSAINMLLKVRSRIRIVFSPMTLPPVGGVRYRANALTLNG